jgi:prepilin-type N-terminal cleavage/methylation domain-containing protein
VRNRRTYGGRSTALARGEAGFTLVELLVSMSLLTIVMGALLGIADSSLPVAARDQERAHVLGEAQSGLDRMTRELRQATKVVWTSPTADAIWFEVDRTGSTVEVLYDCRVQPVGKPYRQCVKATGTNPAVAPSVASGRVVIDRVLNGTAAAATHPTVFSFSPNATSPVQISAEIVVAAQGERHSRRDYTHQFVLDDGVYMRNLGSQ